MGRSPVPTLSNKTKTLAEARVGPARCIPEPVRGATGIRTPDLVIANDTRYQLRHSPARDINKPLCFRALFGGVPSITFSELA